MTPRLRYRWLARGAHTTRASLGGFLFLLLITFSLLGMGLRNAEAEPEKEDSLPPSFRCLMRYYGVKSEHRDGALWATLPNGQALPYDDGKPKSAEALLETPDLQDMFTQRYQKGPIKPVTSEQEDPGRIRVDALFSARYGMTEKQIPVVAFLLFGHRLRVHRLVEPAFVRLRARLTELTKKDPSLQPYLEGLGGTFVWRNIAGTNRRSAHSYGVSLDINVKRSHYWRWQRPPSPLRWQNQIPQPIVDAFEAEGFIWGGRWYHYDTMHFEYRPELLDPSCY